MHFKSSEIYKVSGSMKQGKFVSNDGTEVEITPELISKIYQNVKGHIPYYLSHDNPLIRTPIGYAYKVGKDEGDNTLLHEGFVFDKKAQRELAINYSDKISPEIDLEIDKETGKITNASLHALSFVHNPAIPDTKVEIIRQLFSKGENESSMQDKDVKLNETVVNPITGTETVGNVTITAPVSQEQPKVTIPPAPVVQERQTPVTIVDITKYEDRIKELEMKLEEDKKFKESVFNEKYTNVVNDLKSLGVTDVENVVTDLPVDQKILVLTKMKEKIIKTAPIGNPSSDIGASNQKDSNVALEERLKSLHISKDYYDRVMNKK